MIPFSGPIVTRETGRSAGLKRFFTGVPCGRGHISERHIGSGECVVCRKAQRVREYAKHKDKDTVRSKAWYAKNKEYVKGYELSRRDHINDVRRSRDREKINAVRKKWDSRNRKRIAEVAKLFYEANRGKFRAYQSEYYRKNSEEQKARARNRRARVKNAIGQHTKLDIDRIYEKQRGCCAICFKALCRKFHIDHLMPLYSGGTNDPSNLQLTCAYCNLSKGKKDPIEFARGLGRLL